MLHDRPLRIEVLLNSPGPHDQVRVRDPFSALCELGVDCRIHESPFLMSQCIRPHSMVIWQRPLPDSWTLQSEHLQWMRERGCLLLTEWDDHPDLFPGNIPQHLYATGLAPIVLCHALHSSTSVLLNSLAKYQPLGFVFENTVVQLPSINLLKQMEVSFKVFIGNQNRRSDHARLVRSLRVWLHEDPNLHIVCVGDSDLAQSLPKNRCDNYPLLSYGVYRRLLGTCQMALLPLGLNLPNRCKTVIKWIESAAESVVVVAGPELYQSISTDGSGSPTAIVVDDLDALVPAARAVSTNLGQRLALVDNAYRCVERDWCFSDFIRQRLDIYHSLWQHRFQLDQRLLERLSSSVPLLSQC